MINEFDVPSDEVVANDSSLIAFGDPATGRMFKGTVAQAKKAFATFNLKYTTVGTEGSTLTLPELGGKELVMVVRESSIIHEVFTVPDTAEFRWDGTDIELGAAVAPGERFIILYKSAPTFLP